MRRGGGGERDWGRRGSRRRGREEREKKVEIGEEVSKREEMKGGRDPLWDKVDCCLCCTGCSCGLFRTIRVAGAHFLEEDISVV